MSEKAKGHQRSPARMFGAYTFAHDFVGEGFAPVFERLTGAGLGAVTVAMAYHTARDIFPHNPGGMVQYLEGGVTYFHPNDEQYPDRSPRPIEGRLTRGSGFAEAFLREAGRYDFATAAWIVALHNTRLAMERPDCAPRTALGDSLLNGLCPANPHVRGYVLGLAQDVASRGFDEVKLESIGYMGFDHGYHHERSLIELSPRVRFLLGICFCEHCVAAAARGGVDTGRVKAAVAGAIRGELRSARHEADDPFDREELGALAGGEMEGWFLMRTQVVTSLVRDLVAAVDAVARGVHVRVIDASGAVLGYATGRPETPAPATSVAWMDGLDLATASEICSLAITGYFADAGRLSAELASYKEILGADAYGNVELVLRPTAPDTGSASELDAKIRLATSTGVRQLSFYHYGLMRLESLDWIAAALQASSSGEGASAPVGGSRSQSVGERRVHEIRR